MKVSPETIQKLADGDSVALRELMPVIRKCARAGCIKARVEFLAEDVQQELMVLLVTKLAQKFDPEYNLEPILIETARRIALGESRKHSRGGIMFVKEEALTDLYDTLGAGTTWQAHGISAAAEADGDRLSVANGISPEGNGDSTFASESQTNAMNAEIDRRHLLSRVYERHAGLRIQLLSILNNSATDAGESSPEENDASKPPRGNKVPKDTHMNASLTTPPKNSTAKAPEEARSRGRATRPSRSKDTTSTEAEISLTKRNTWPSNVCVDGEVPTFPPLALPVPKEPAKTSASTRDGRLLKDIREKSGRTQFDMASELGLHPSTYLSYEYGRVKQVPLEVLRKANSIRKKDEGDAVFWASKFEGLTMREISADWARRLNVDPDQVTKFASRLGVNKSTISRWRQEGQRPTLREIVVYENHVKELEVMLGKASQFLEKATAQTPTSPSKVPRAKRVQHRASDLN